MKQLVRTIFLLFLLAVQATAVRAETSEAEDLFQQAAAGYEAEHYKDALALVQKAVELEPGNSSYQHLLGKCYGRLAEQAGFLSAMSLANKTRQALEKAVELDGHNINALKDLMQYYRQAPGFLGGSKKKANEIERQLKELDVSAG